MIISSRKYVIALLVLLPLVTAGCERQPPAPYVPGLGEIMSATQMRHTKLWFAGKARNWPLAAYELDELKEGFDDVVTFHPTHKDAPAPLAELLPQITGAPLKMLDEAISAKDSGKFVKAFDALTGACNACHQAAKFGFNVVTRPTANPYTNQNFEAPR
jgi:hypothetical protein